MGHHAKMISPCLVTCPPHVNSLLSHLLQTHVARTLAKMEDPAPTTPVVVICAPVLLDTGGWPARPIPHVCMLRLMRRTFDMFGVILRL